MRVQRRLREFLHIRTVNFRGKWRSAFYRPPEDVAANLNSSPKTNSLYLQPSIIDQTNFHSIMGYPSFKNTCETDLGLHSAAAESLKAAARVILEQEGYAEQGIYAFKDVYSLAVAYVEEGWDSATIQLSPGKRFWTSSDIDSDKHLLTYPQDKER